MPEKINPSSADFDEANSKLNEGLRSCRAVVSGYRALLTRAANSDQLGEEESSELDEAANGTASTK